MKVDAPVERNNYFLQTTDALFVQEPFAKEPEKTAPTDIRLRYERQTFQRLPISKAIAFLVRTYITPLVDLADEPESLKELLGAMRALPQDMADYKGKQIWGDVVEKYCTEQLEMHGLAGVDPTDQLEAGNEKRSNEKMSDASIVVKIQEVVTED